jgi:UMF1 family MFS transporter
VRAIAFVLVGWLVTIALAAGAQTPAPFWAAAALAGLCLGASRSGGRALIGLLSPPSRRAEFFGFWGLAMKLSAILGPLSYGLVTWATDGDHRRALWATGLFFLVGLALLGGVRAGRGRRAALRAERDFAKESACIATTAC